MSAEFIDSNVFVYLFDETAPAKRQVAETLIQRALETRASCISYQVVQETLNVLTRSIDAPIPVDKAHQFLDRVLLPLCRVMPSGTSLAFHSLR